ncbi:NAD(P)-binding protein [Pseudovirgaria hyperparasitica]|uniref:NAD(P)-binding protein n=1 Tax=Pseudovirgaria hyperparasitica TaxID=470096 RepID=A0A6A6VYG0_9PEZI|nr:NAD(P)-binding protein [Pseudovirgaria hyperparasitica]KAF2755688.1 NAD(P)-binding protein [Pseudovirgaria hyperparasitica]
MSGKLIPNCLKLGQVLNLDLVPLDNPKVFSLDTDLTESGQISNALTTHFNFSGYEAEGNPKGPDVVIHFAAYARNMLVPDNECYKGNVLSTYNVIEATWKLGIPKIVIASGETIYGGCFAQGGHDYESFPSNEDLDVNPMDTYTISKLCRERVARGFARRFGVDIYALRIGNVIEPHEYERDFPKYVNP